MRQIQGHWRRRESAASKFPGTIEIIPTRHINLGHGVADHDEPGLGRRTEDETRVKG